MRFRILSQCKLVKVDSCFYVTKVADVSSLPPMRVRVETLSTLLRVLSYKLGVLRYFLISASRFYLKATSTDCIVNLRCQLALSTAWICYSFIYLTPLVIQCLLQEAWINIFLLWWFSVRLNDIFNFRELKVTGERKDILENRGHMYV